MPSKFGELVVDQGYVTPEQLEEVIQLQKKGRARLGQIMKQMRMLLDEDVEKVLEYQQSEAGKGKRFGECALELELVSEDKLAEAVRYQTTSKGVLGDILVEMGYLTESQRDEVIRLQAMQV